MREIAIAAIAALAPTIASMAALVKVIKLGRTTEAVNNAVNHQPPDAPKLIDRVVTISDDMAKLRNTTAMLNRQMQEVREAHKRHMAWHQEQTEKE